MTAVLARTNAGTSHRRGDSGMAALARAQAYADQQRARFLADLKTAIRFPTVSSQPVHRSDLQRCAGWLADHLRRMGLPRVMVVPTPTAPLVYAEHLNAPGRPTVLIYGHYDVQPAEPLEAWRSPPFEPVVQGDHLHGRGAADNKGQLFAHLNALASYLRTSGRLPINVKVIIDGSEEIDSPALRGFLLRNRRRLVADGAVLSDTRMLGVDRPSLTYSLRGRLSLEIGVAGATDDLHSGNFGGALGNPARILARLVAGLYDEDGGRVAVPGFYRRVRPVADAERELMARTGPTDREILATAGASLPAGEPGFSAYERTTIRPALEVSGLVSGHTGPGPKSVIPARAIAKLDVRLVPDQDPLEIERLVRAHLDRNAPPGTRVTLTRQSVAAPVVLDRGHPVMRAAGAAIQTSFGRPPVWLRSGGTIAVVEMFRSVLKVPTALMGFALPDSHVHAPNERLHLPTFWKGIRASLVLLAHLGRTSIPECSESSTGCSDP